MTNYRFAVVDLDLNKVTNLITSASKESAEAATGMLCIQSKTAEIGDDYYPELEAVLKPQPFESWELDLDIKDWVAPVAKPEDDLEYEWDEESQSWQEVAEEVVEEAAEDTASESPAE